jgi:serine/threonine protein phosphatase PrpC
MQRPSSSQKNRIDHNKRVLERNSLPDNSGTLKKAEFMPYNDIQNQRVSRHRESLNYRSENTKEHVLKNSLDYLSKHRLKAEPELFQNDIRNLPSNYRTDVSRKQKRYKVSNDKFNQNEFAEQGADRDHIPNIYNPSKILRKTVTEQNVTNKNGRNSTSRSPMNLRDSKYSSNESIQTVNFPKVDDRSTKATHISKNVPYISKLYGNSSIDTIKANPLSNFSEKQIGQKIVSTNKIQSYNIDSFNSSLGLSVDHKSSQDKDRNSRNNQTNSSFQKSLNSNDSQSNSNSNTTTGSQNGMQIFSGLTNKNISLLPARSSNFVFNGSEAMYSVNTTNGLIRGYNEDRVSIVINIKRKAEWKQTRWPNCSYFSIFDGHGGSLCADFLKDNLHRFILENKNFPDDPRKSIEEGCVQAENEFCQFALKQKNIERSGSCALIILAVDDKIYIGNVGDCRAIVSEQKGKQFFSLSKDHKPEEQSEHDRILRNGGQVLKNNLIQANKLMGSAMGVRLNDLPFRVYPGGLSVSRSFGDVIAKEAQFGGNPNVLIAKPEITTYRIDKRTDFIFIGCSLNR